MTGPAWLLIAVLVAAATAAAWPSSRARKRLRPQRSRAGRRHPAMSVPRPPAWRDLVANRSPRRLIAMATTGAGALGWLAGGPVAALAGGVYGALAARAATRAASKRRHVAARAGQLDDLSALAADLRAGLPPAGAAEAHADVLGASDPSAASERGPGGRILELTGAVLRLAERTGAPAADLIERIERDARAADRARASAAAQAAGAQATALLLAALPVGGIALGYAIGADPLQVLLHTPLGAACAAGALLLQSGGLLWADRLTNGAAR